MSAQEPRTLVSDERRERVARAVRAWVDSLVDLSGRNQLLYYRSLKAGTLELTDAPLDPRERLLAGAVVPVSELFPPDPEHPGVQGQAVKRARTILRKAQENYEERGIDTLFIAAGVATWTSESSKSTPASPVLLGPATIVQKGSRSEAFEIQLSGEWSINHALLHLLRAEFDVRPSPEALESVVDALESLGSEGFEKVFATLIDSADDVPDFEVTDRVVMGNFSYTKLPMVRDLETNIEELTEHDLLAAVAGDETAREAVRQLRSVEVSPNLPDHTEPSDEFLVLDADSSQSAVINAVVAGQPLVVQGPPGTGKSQTISNLIATTVARGGRVLFVAEKRAAIDAVTKRLDKTGLGGLVLDLHGGIRSRRAFAQEMAAALEEMGRAPKVDTTETDRALKASRRALVEYVQARHAERSPWGLSLDRIEQQLIELDARSGSALRMGRSDAERIDPARLNELCGLVEEWVERTSRLRSGDSPWAGARIADRDQVEAAFGLIDSLSSATLPGLERDLRQIVTDLGIDEPSSLSAWTGALGLLRDASEVLANADAGLFGETEALGEGLAPGGRGAIGRASAQTFSSRYRTTKKRARELRRGEGKPGGQELFELVSRASDVNRRWSEAGWPGRPTSHGSTGGAIERFATVNDQLAAAGAFLVSSRFEQMSTAAAQRQIDELFADESTLRQLPRIDEIERELSDHGLEELLTAIRAGSISDADEAIRELRSMWFTAARHAVLGSDRRLAEFDGGVHSGQLVRFRGSDQQHLEGAAGRVRRAAAEHAIAARNAHPDQNELVRREANKKSRHIPVRELFERAPDVLTRIRPCWTMSPLVVSQVLPASQLFDLVIFDEASQVKPADAIPALLRASQAVVAGDRKQLPPTSFFAGGADVEDEEEELEDVVSGFESILDVLDTIVGNRMLTWHYRSEDERLISFSNHNLYDGGLVTFPGVGDGSALRWEYVPWRAEGVGEARSNSDEVRRVVELMIEHAESRQDESLGVIAMGVHHANRIQGELDAQLADLSPEVRDFFGDSREERTFIKNIERVQGDERDAIILSVGYSKDADGRLPFRFGPLLQEGGERRLNVAVTRARRRTTLVSSITHADMDPAKCRHGVEFLRRYLKYAESGGQDLGGAELTAPLNPFEIDVKHRLERAGLTVHPQLGVSGFRIDFAIPHPDGSRYLLAVEADGASYHSSPTARDRDRLRQQVLEARGWTFHRIWSTDWFNDPDRETAKVVDAFQLAVEAADREPVLAAPTTSAPRPQPATLASTPARSLPNPRLGRRDSITEYSSQELKSLARWIASDDLLRTEDEMVNEMMEALGFRRRGSRIVDALTRAARAIT